MAYAPESIRTIISDVFDGVPYQSLNTDTEGISNLLAAQDGLRIEARIAHGYDFENFDQLIMFGVKMDHIDGWGVYDQESCILTVGNSAETTDCIRIVLSSLYMVGFGRFREMEQGALQQEFTRMAEIIREQRGRDEDL